MEVHHHAKIDPDNHRQKYFREYLLEFVMLFLAVFLGFIAENIREHQVEKRKEKEFVMSLSNDIKTDISHLEQVIIQRQTKDVQIDSLMFLLNAGDRNENGNSLYFNSVHMARRMNTRFTPNDGAIEQLKNAGGLRMISDRNVADSIAQYDVNNRNITKLQELEDAIVQDYRSTEFKVFNPLVFEQMLNEENEATRPVNNPALLPFDKIVLNEMNSRLHTLKLFNRGVLRDCKMHLAQAQNLLAVLNKEYHLD